MTGDLIQRLERFTRERNAQVSIMRPKGVLQPPVWAVELLWGQEAPDSPMAGAAAYGMDEDLDVAITQALEEAGL